MASHKGNIIISQCVLTVKIDKLPKARENVGDAVFVLYSDWSRGWREFSRPITERGKTKNKALPDYLRHLVENCSDWTIWLNYLNVNQIKGVKIRMKR